MTTEFEINRNAVKTYFMATWVLACIIILVLLSPLGLAILKSAPGFREPILVVLGLLAVFIFWLCPQQANALRYRLEGSTLCADGGVFFLFRKSIPLERITDVALVQGPLLRLFGIWAIRIQTAGSPQCEATLYGVRDHEKVRELILSSRQRIYGEKSGDA